MNFREVQNDDPISPTSIEHNVDEIWEGDELAQRYNFLVYNFEDGNASIWAKSYADEFHTITMYGPHDREDRTRQVENAELAQRVHAYLSKRFGKVVSQGCRVP